MQSLLNDPNPKSAPKYAANSEAAKMLMTDPKSYFEKVKECAMKCKKPDPIPIEPMQIL